MFSALSKTDAALLALGCVLILVPVYALTPVALTNASAFAISNVATASVADGKDLTMHAVENRVVGERLPPREHHALN